jgi:hypothetical protein
MGAALMEITGIIIGLVMMASRMVTSRMVTSRMVKCDWTTPVAPELARKQGWTKRVWTKQLRPVALGGALGLAALAGISPGVAHAQDSGGDSGIFGSMLKGLGIGGENNIEYRERPPLVVPPSRDLPPPQASRAVRDPNWPVDPKSGETRKKSDQVRDLDKLPVPQRAATPSPSPDATAAIPPSQPAASGSFFGNLFSSSGTRPAAPMPGAPMRKSLTEPPPDYESPSPSQPYGQASPAAPAKTTPESALQAGQPASQPGSPGL